MAFDKYNLTPEEYRVAKRALGSEYLTSGAYNNLSQGYDSPSSIIAAVKDGSLDPYTAQVMLANGGPAFYMNEDQEKAFNNLLARYQSQNALIWQADQMQKLGLSASGVLQTGAAHTAQDWSNVSSRRTDRKVALMGNIANSMISMAGRMGSAGIHGAALTAVKGAASSAATSLAHTASTATRSLHSSSSSMSQKEEEELMAFFNNR